MIRAVGAAGLLVLLGAGTACRPGAELDDTELAQRAQRLSNAMRSDTATGPLARWILPSALNEVSGLALSPDGRLFAHGDEAAVIFEIDYRHGVMVKHFQLGRRAVRDDFEAIEIVGDQFFLLASDGRIYRFREGDANARVDYDVFDTGLGSRCEFEGMAWDSAANQMVLACKNIEERRLRDHVVLYRVALDSNARAADPLIIPLERARRGNSWDEIKPSDVTVDAATGTYFIVAAQQKGLLQITRQGDVLAAGPLPDDLEFAEGLAITSDSLMIISTEAMGGPPAIQIYPRP